MTTYHIIHYTKESQLGDTVFSLDYFRKTELESQFYALVKKLKPGESAEYMKSDNRNFYPSIMYIENENGTLYSYTHTGHRKVSKYNSL